MAGMTPYDFFDGIVADDYNDWKSEPESIRRGFHVAVSAFHLADHYFKYHARRNRSFSQRYKSLNKFQAALTSRIPAFKVIQDMANAYKHLYTRASCSIASSGSIESVICNGQEIAQNWQEAGGNFTGEILIRHKNGAVTHFSGAIHDVIEMWTQIMRQGESAII